MLNHFFGRETNEDGPVVVLLVTAEELARAANAPLTSAEDVRAEFLACVRRSIRRNEDLLEDASDYLEWPKAPLAEDKPGFVAHLLFTCVAAAESEEELADEGSFILRLRKLTEHQLADASLAYLPQLWTNLAAWLHLRRHAYRELILPDPGGLTRIGHTVRLTFPDRRDQADLSALLGQSGLAGAEPPVRLVCQVVSEHRAKFSRRFLAEFDDFQRQASDSPTSRSLREHRFWAAIRAAALRGRVGESASVDSKADGQLMAEMVDEQLSLFIAARLPTAIEGFIWLTVPYDGEWSHVLQPAGSSKIEVGQLRAAVHALLGGLLPIGDLTATAREGLLPFVEDASGLLRLAASAETEEARIALVRDDLVPSLTATFATTSLRRRASEHVGWTELHGLRLRRLPVDVLERAGLGRCRNLRERLLPPQLKPLGGVRLDNGWLGFVEVLPTISGVGAKSVQLVDEDNDRQPLTDQGDGRWSLPSLDLFGQFSLIGDFGELGSIRRDLVLQSLPPSDKYLSPPNRDVWVVEGLMDSGPLGHDPWISTEDTGLDATRLCEQIDLLGPIVGEFVDDSAAAAVRIVRFAGATLGTCERRELCIPPVAQVADAGARRRWRKLLKAAIPDGPEFAEARRSLTRRNGSPKVVERRIDSTSHLYRPEPSLPSRRVDRLVAILAAIASRRQELPLKDWRDLIVDVLAPPTEQLGHVMRAWEEAGFVDMGVYARWRRRSVIARQPLLVAVRVGDAWRATIIGLALPSTLAEVEEGARAVDALVEHRPSVSEFVPTSRTIRAASAATLKRIADRAGIEMRWLSLDFLRSSVVPRGRLQPAPLGYDQCSVVTKGVVGTPLPATTALTRSFRPESPDCWATTGSGGQRAWTYHRNLALCWAAFFAEQLPCEAEGSDVRARLAYLPLPLARVAAVLGAALPGPVGTDRTYRYSCVSNELPQLLLREMASHFERREGVTANV